MDQGDLIPRLEVEQRLATIYKALAQAIETYPDRAERERGVEAEVVVLLQELGDGLRDDLYAAAMPEGAPRSP